MPLGVRSMCPLSPSLPCPGRLAALWARPAPAGGAAPAALLRPSHAAHGKRAGAQRRRWAGCWRVGGRGEVPGRGTDALAAGQWKGRTDCAPAPGPEAEGIRHLAITAISSLRLPLDDLAPHLPLCRGHCCAADQAGGAGHPHLRAAAGCAGSAGSACCMQRTWSSILCCLRVKLSATGLAALLAQSYCQPQSHIVLPAGRGALTLGTLRPLPTEPLHIPPLCLGAADVARLADGVSCFCSVTVGPSQRHVSQVLLPHAQP